MLKMLTAKGQEYPIVWAGISDLDGSLRFEVIGSDLPELFRVFSDSEHTKILTRVFDEDRRTYEGYTTLKGIERMGSGNIVVRLLRGEFV